MSLFLLYSPFPLYTHTNKHTHKHTAKATMPPPSKSSSRLRWVILLAASLLMLSNYYVYDIPASLKDLLRQNMGLDKSDFEVCMYV